MSNYLKSNFLIEVKMHCQFNRFFFNLSRDNNIIDEDSCSSSSSSRHDQTALSINNPIFHSSTNRKLSGYSLANTISKRNMLLNSSTSIGQGASSDHAPLAKPARRPKGELHPFPRCSVSGAEVSPVLT